MDCKKAALEALSTVVIHSGSFEMHEITVHMYLNELFSKKTLSSPIDISVFSSESSHESRFESVEN